MMRFWANTLRVLGFTLFVWTVANQSWWALGMLGAEEPIIRNILESAVTAALCFGAAAALIKLESLDDRISRQNAAIRRLMPQSARKPIDDDLAPVAPQNWTNYKQRALDPEREKDSAYEQRLARRWRYRVKATVRH
jgi:hypothetical protein